jgi:hypothetical protein
VASQGASTCALEIRHTDYLGEKWSLTTVKDLLVVDSPECSDLKGDLLARCSTPADKSFRLNQTCLPTYFLVVFGSIPYSVSSTAVLDALYICTGDARAYRRS